MAGSDLVAYLVKYVGGEKHCAKNIAQAFDSMKLILHLAEDVSPAEAATATTFKIFLQKESDNMTAFVFSAEEYFSRWCYDRQRPPLMVEVSGADLCVALPKGTWLFLDSASPHAVMLPPAFLNQVAEGNFEITEESYPVPKSPMAFLFGETKSTNAGLYNPNPGAELVVVENKKVKLTDPANVTTEKKPSKPFMMRSNPTQFFSAPQMAKKEEVVKGPRPRSYTSSNLGKIIRTNNGDKDKS